MKSRWETKENSVGTKVDILHRDTENRKSRRKSFVMTLCPSVVCLEPVLWRMMATGKERRSTQKEDTAQDT